MSAPLAEVDPDIAELLGKELGRQRDTLEMIASENFVPQAVLDATIGQARIITDGNAPFNQMTWRALLRKLDRDAPDYKT